MSTKSTRSGDTLERILPLLIVVAIVLVGYLWFIQPRVTEYLRARADALVLENRVQMLQDTVNRGRTLPPVDEQTTMAEFTRRVSADDRIADVVERLAQAAIQSCPPDRFRGLSIQAGERIGVPDASPSRTFPGQAAGDMRSEQADPRVSLFNVPVDYTPVTMSFESTFEGIAGFTWRIRDLPTLVEIRSFTLTRGLPLMKAEFELLVYRRAAGATAAPVQPTAPPQPAPVTPRVAQVLGTER